MRMLLTSAGAHNETIRKALDDLLPRPIEECTAIFIPTAMYGHPHAGPGVNAWEFAAGRSEVLSVTRAWPDRQPQDPGGLIERLAREPVTTRAVGTIERILTKLA